MTPPTITLASGSAIRAKILRGAGVDFEIRRPDVDESVIKQAALRAGVDLETMAMRLAEAKCMKIAPDCADLVIGADQILEFDGEPYDKPATMDEARARFVKMQGAEHSLINATVLARDGEIIWRHIERPKLKMRAMTPAEIDAYLAASGDGVLASVGAYQLESFGARLFDYIDGDYFTVLGLALFPLLTALRQENALTF